MSLWSSITDTVGGLFGGSSSGGGLSWGNIISGGLSAAGSLMSSHAQSQAASQMAQAQSQEGTLKQIEYNRQAAEADSNAQLALTQSALRMALIRRQGRETAATQDAQYAGSGVVAGVGSAAYVPSYTVGRAEEDAYSAFQEGQSQSQQLQRQAAAYRTAGEQAYAAGQTAAEGTQSAAKTSSTAGLLGAAAGLAKSWL